MKYGTMAYLISEKGILMIRKGVREEDPNSGYCTLPGGKLEDDEKTLMNSKGRLEGVIRETRDETGIILINPTVNYHGLKPIASEVKNH